MTVSTKIAAESPVSAGEYLGHFEILSELRAGGMATLYVGRRRGAAGFSRLVAIKVVHPHLAKDETFVKMFIDEAKLASRIEHPNVVHVEELGRVGVTYFLVMEYVHGCTLSELLGAVARAHRRMRPDIAVWIAVQVARGLDAAHECTDDEGHFLGVVHRDISPQNVMLSSEGHVKLIDFGVAKAERRASYTAPGALKGKIRYMPPEQIGGEVDRRSDLYALGLVLWEMLTGRRRFIGEDIVLIDEIRAAEHPAPSALASHVPPELDAVILRCLSANPDDRPQTARDFVRELLEACPEAALIDSRDAADLLSHFVGEALEERRQALPQSHSGVNQLSQITGGQRAVFDLTLGNDSQDTLPSGDPGPIEEAEGGARSWLFALAIGLGVGALIAAIALALALGGQEDPPPPTRVPVITAPAPPDPEPEPQVTVEPPDETEIAVDQTAADEDNEEEAEPPPAQSETAMTRRPGMRRRPRTPPSQAQPTMMRQWIGDDGIIDSFD